MPSTFPSPRPEWTTLQSGTPAESALPFGGDQPRAGTSPRGSSSLNGSIGAPCSAQACQYPSSEKGRNILCRARLLTLCTLMLTSVATQGARLQTPVPALAMQAFALHTATGNASVPLDSSIVLGVNHPEITRAAIVLHGKGRNVQGYFRALQNAAAQAGSIGSHTLLLAPQFLREEDIQGAPTAKSVSALARRLMVGWRAGRWAVAVQ